MGTTPSKSGANNDIYNRNEIPVQFSKDVVDHLSDRFMSAETTLQRQTTLDAHIRARIQAELEQLREEEEQVRQKIELALEKENLHKEKSLTSGASGQEEGAKTSAALFGDLNEIRRQVGRFQGRPVFGHDEFSGPKSCGEALVSCYRINWSAPLNCRHEVNNFKTSVAQIEQGYFNALR